MTLIPHRTVASQIAAQLRAELGKGTWNGWLPSERVLSRTVQASRNTVRAALEQLKGDGLIEPVRGLGNRIVGVSRVPSLQDQPKTVGLLIPEPIGRLRPLIALWIDELKDLLIEEGYRLRIHEGRQYYQTNPARALERLVEQNTHGAWVLTLSSESMQRWFARRGVPCLVAGSTFPDIRLPHYDLDYRAICRHAAGVLLRLGHRRLALLNRESPRAGDVDSELGFIEGVKASSQSDTTTEIAYHRDDVESVARALKRLLDRKSPPTALVVCNSYAYLSTVSLLAQRGLRVPQDISLISRDDDPFLASLAPAPARYVLDPHTFAKKMLGALLQLLNRSPALRAPPPLLPKFTSGGSASVPARGE
ncbi:MAG: substrate-binding domain-containing protein [Verrucomicrobia bacterium]|nr:substrate-binding domain-containing protein [Verrucomicrobiota bacterium]